MSRSLAERFLSPAGRAGIERSIAELAHYFNGRLSTGAAVREQHGRGEAYAQSLPPDAVVWPETTAEVSRIVAVCARHLAPVISFGAGTSLEGHVCAPYGGVCIDFSRMNQLVAVHAEDADCVVQPGLTREQLNVYLRDTGLFFPVDPGANATLGGMAATRASGTTTIRYGGMAQNVLALEVVLADGRVIRCGTRARKSAAGYDLVRMLTGSEGTLGVLTEVTLRLYAQPEEVGSMTCAFPTLRDAVDAVIELSQTGVPLARIEFLDDVQMRACNRHSKLGLAEKPTLFIEVHGTTAGVSEHMERARDIACSHGGVKPIWATTPEERSHIWRARHDAYFAALSLRPGSHCIVADICVPISSLADVVAETRLAIDAAGLLAPIVGHVGDGNFHVLFLHDPAAADERARIDAVYDAMITRALSVGGTCTGEHGIGLGKQAKLVEECGEDVVALMRELKQAWDPQGILNPGKILLEAPQVPPARGALAL